MQPSSEPVCGIVAGFARIDGVLFTRQEVADALDALDAVTDSRIEPTLTDIESPLAMLPIWDVADRYKDEYPADASYDAVEPGKLRATPRIKAFRCLLKRLQDGLDGRITVPTRAIQEDDVLPDNAEDNRRRVIADIVRRNGQQAFRYGVMRAYDCQCAITGWNVPETLDAAHIRPYHGPNSDKVSNGLLLRADIHRLFDAHLLAIDPQSRHVVLAPRMRETLYGPLHGTPLTSPPSGPPPKQKVLDERWECFLRKLQGQ